MDDREIETRLKALDVPPPRPEQIEKTLDLALRDFNTARSPAETNRRRRPVAVACGALGLAATIVLAVLLFRDVPIPGTNPAHAPQAELFSTKDWRQIVRELQGLFPERLQAVVATDNEVDVRLHREPRRTSDQPILVALHAPNGPEVELVSFSGEVVETEVADSRVTLELFLTAPGEVLLTGDHFFWTHRDSAGLGIFTIRANPLEIGS